MTTTADQPTQTLMRTIRSTSTSSKATTPTRQLLMNWPSLILRRAIHEKTAFTREARMLAYGILIERRNASSGRRGRG